MSPERPKAREQVPLDAGNVQPFHFGEVIMAAMASQVTGISIVCSIVCSGADQRKHVTGLCEGNPPMTDGFPSQRATSNAENISFWWSPHVTLEFPMEVSAPTWTILTIALPIFLCFPRCQLLCFRVTRCGWKRFTVTWAWIRRHPIECLYGFPQFHVIGNRGKPVTMRLCSASTEDNRLFSIFLSLCLWMWLCMRMSRVSTSSDDIFDTNNVFCWEECQFF